MKCIKLIKFFYEIRYFKCFLVKNILNFTPKILEILKLTNISNSHKKPSKSAPKNPLIKSQKNICFKLNCIKRYYLYAPLLILKKGQ